MEIGIKLTFLFLYSRFLDIIRIIMKVSKKVLFNVSLPSDFQTFFKEWYFAIGPLLLPEKWIKLLTKTKPAKK